MITFSIGALIGICIGYELPRYINNKISNRRFRKSLRIAMRSYKRRQKNVSPRKVHTAGDDYV